MALIKCPECRKEVSTAASTCPHCGFPLKKVTYQQLSERFPRPKNPSWVKKWKNKVTRVKVIWTLILLATIIGLFISLLLLFNDKNAVKYSWGTSYYTKTIHFVFTFIFGFFTFVNLIIWLVVLISFRIRSRQYDGYMIVVYNGFKHILVVEDEIQDSGIINRYLYGHLPNNKQVWTSISSRDGSVKMGIGSEGDEKQLL